MTNSQLFGSLKDNSKDLLQGKFGRIILIFLINSVATMFITDIGTSISSGLLSALQYLTNTETVTLPLMLVTYVVSVVFAIFCNVFQIGFSMIYLRIACGMDFSLSDLFYGYTHRFGRSFGLSAVLTLVAALYTLPLNLAQYYRSKGASFADMRMVLIALAVGFIIYIPISLALSQSIYLMLDFPGNTVGKNLSDSIRLMKGHMLTFFLLQLSFLPLMCLNLFTMLLGTLWLTPYFNVTYALFFLHLMRSRDE